MENILDFSNTYAREFFLKEESYFNFDLPIYFEFEPLLEQITQELDGSNLSDFYSSYIDESSGNEKATYPNKYEDVNFKFLNNKNGKFAWRPFQLIHPALYVSLTKKITEENNWKFIISRILEFQQNSKIKCFSLPIESTDDSLSDKAASITNWWQSIEQKSIELSLEYEYLVHTDISDCYGSIYTHSIAWALHTKQTAKENRYDDDLIGNVIDNYLQDMSYGQTNGIPQGSVLMDLIAEIVLGYADLKLSERLEGLTVEDYKIIRYRDDYRIFTNNPQDGELILKHLTEVLIDLNLELNPDKTFVTSDVVQDSIKPDKLYWNVSKQGAKNLQTHLLVIHDLAKKYPNSGSLIKALNSYYDRISNLEETYQNISALISILVDIAFKNPRVYSISAAILSELLSFLDSQEDRGAVINKIVNKFNLLPNTGHLQIWLQRITINYEREQEYSELLCKKVNDSSVKIWNSEWLSERMKNLIDNVSIVNEEVIDSMDQTIEPEEVQLFESKSPYN